MRAPCSLLFLYLFKPVEGSSTERSKSAKPFVTLNSLPAGTYKAVEQNGTICPELPRLLSFEMVVTSGGRGQLASFNAEVRSTGSPARHESIRSERRAALVWYAVSTTSPLRRLGSLRLREQPACFHVEPSDATNGFLGALYAQLQLEKASQLDRDLIVCQTELGLVVGLGANRTGENDWQSTDYGILLERPFILRNQFVAALERKKDRPFHLPFRGPFRKLAIKRKTIPSTRPAAPPMSAVAIPVGREQVTSSLRPPEHRIASPSTNQERIAPLGLGVSGNGASVEREFHAVTFRGNVYSKTPTDGVRRGASERSFTVPAGGYTLADGLAMKEGARKRHGGFMSREASPKVVRTGKRTFDEHVGADSPTSSFDVWNFGVRRGRRADSVVQLAKAPIKFSEPARRGIDYRHHEMGAGSYNPSADSLLFPFELEDLWFDPEARSDEEWIQSLLDSAESTQSEGNTAEHHHEMDGGSYTEDEDDLLFPIQFDHLLPEAGAHSNDEWVQSLIDQARASYPPPPAVVSTGGWQRGYAESHQEGADEVSSTSPSIPDGRYLVTDTGLDLVNMVAVSIRTDYPPHRRRAQLIFHIRRLECPMTLPEVTAVYNEGCLQLDFSSENYELDLIILRDTLGFAEISPSSFRICGEAGRGWSLMFDTGNNGASGETTLSTVKLKLLET